LFQQHVLLAPPLTLQVEQDAARGDQKKRADGFPEKLSKEKGGNKKNKKDKRAVNSGNEKKWVVSTCIQYTPQHYE
jgi:hypothetical protein